MYARFVNFTLGPDTRATAEAMAEEAYGISKGLDGFVSALYTVVDEATGEYGSVTVWKTEADADAAGERLRPWMIEKIGGQLKGPPAIRTAEVYEPKG